MNTTAEDEMKEKQKCTCRFCSKHNCGTTIITTTAIIRFAVLK
jgi:hypothetical protein